MSENLQRNIEIGELLVDAYEENELSQGFTLDHGHSHHDAICQIVHAYLHLHGLGSDEIRPLLDRAADNVYCEIEGLN